MPENLKVVQILSNVEDEYDALVTAIASWNIERLTVREVSGRLIKEKKTRTGQRKMKLVNAGEWFEAGFTQV